MKNMDFGYQISYNKSSEFYFPDDFHRFLHYLQCIIQNGQKRPKMIKKWIPDIKFSQNHEKRSFSMVSIDFYIIRIFMIQN